MTYNKILRHCSLHWDVNYMSLKFNQNKILSEISLAKKI